MADKLLTLGSIVARRVDAPPRYEEYLRGMNSTAWHYYREEGECIAEEEFFNEHGMDLDDHAVVETYFHFLKQSGVVTNKCNQPFATSVFRAVLYFPELPIPTKWYSVPTWDMEGLVRYEVSSTIGVELSPLDIYNISKAYFATHDSSYNTKPPRIVITQLMRVDMCDDTGDGLRVEVVLPENGEKL